MIKTLVSGLFQFVKFLVQPGTLLSEGIGVLAVIVCYLFLYRQGQLDSVAILCLVVLGLIGTVTAFVFGYVALGDNWPQWHRERTGTIHEPTNFVDLRKRPERFDESWSSRRKSK